MKPSITAKNLIKSYPDGANKQRLEVLKGINLTVEAGKMIAIMGRSGSGKSSLLHVLSGLDTLDSGEVQLGLVEAPLSKLSEAQLNMLRNQHLGFIWQFHHLLPELSVIENVLLPAMMFSGFSARYELKAHAKELLGQLGLVDKANQLISALSGGQRQRVAIARALINHPQLILADEPTGNLDAATAKEVIAIITKLVKEGGATFIVATHDKEVAAKMDEVYELVSGKLVRLALASSH